MKNSIDELKIEMNDKYLHLSREVRLVSKFYDPRSDKDLSRYLSEADVLRTKVEKDSERMEATRIEWTRIYDEEGEQAFWAAVFSILSASFAGLYGFWIGLGFHKKQEGA